MTGKLLKTKLGEVAHVRSGLVLARKKACGKQHVSYPALNFRAVRENGSISQGDLDTFSADGKLSAEYLSQIGDVIVRLTEPYTAALIKEGAEGIVISSNFVIIRQTKRALLPEYLFWLLNTTQMKHDIYRNSTSNMLAAVKAGYFENLMIRMIPLEQQKRIAEMNLLAKQEVSLLTNLAKEKELYYAAVIGRMQREMVKND